jgi:aspartyl protease family protein
MVAVQGFLRGHPVQSRGPVWFWLAVFAIGLLGLVMLLKERFPEALERGTVSWPVYLVLLLLLGGGGMVLAIRQRPLQHLRDAAIWLGLGLVLVVGYSFRDEILPRLKGELVPAAGIEQADGSVTFRAGRDGYFHVEGRVNGRRILFLVDTGASEVVLSPADARRLGIDVDRLAFTQVTETANGFGRGAPVTLREVEVGGLRVAEVSASVNQADMGQSLLGMSFLRRIGGFQVSGDRLTLHP